MTFAELNKKLGGFEKESDWHQHKNGGGWLNKTAKVDATSYVGENAIVWGMVSGNAQYITCLCIWRYTRGGRGFPRV